MTGVPGRTPVSDVVATRRFLQIGLEAADADGAYRNATWVIGTAKCGNEEGSMMVGQSVIIAPSGEIVAQAHTIEDEIITAKVDLDLGKRYRETIFDIARHREPGSYGLIVERKGAGDPLPHLTPWED